MQFCFNSAWENSIISAKNRADFRRFSEMNILCIDYGHKRVGLACADSELKVAVPIPAAVEGNPEARLDHIAREIRERKIGRIVVGYPYNMDGSAGFKAREVDAFIAEIEKKFGLPVVRFDERLSSFQAEADYSAVSRAGKKSVAARKKLRRSGEIDSRASALILREYLESDGGGDSPEGGGVF